MTALFARLGAVLGRMSSFVKWQLSLQAAGSRRNTGSGSIRGSAWGGNARVRMVVSDGGRGSCRCDCLGTLAPARRSRCRGGAWLVLVAVTAWISSDPVGSLWGAPAEIAYAGAVVVLAFLLARSWAHGPVFATNVGVD